MQSILIHETRLKRSDSYSFNPKKVPQATQSMI